MDPIAVSISVASQVLCAVVLALLVHERGRRVRGQGPLFGQPRSILGTLGLIGSLMCLLNALLGSGSMGALRGGSSPQVPGVGQHESQTPRPEPSEECEQPENLDAESPPPANRPPQNTRLSQHRVPDFVYWCNKCGTLDNHPIIHRDNPPSAPAGETPPSSCPASGTPLGQRGSENYSTPNRGTRLTQLAYCCPKCNLTDESPLLHFDGRDEQRSTPASDASPGLEGMVGPRPATPWPWWAPHPMYWCCNCGALVCDPIIRHSDGEETETDPSKKTTAILKFLYVPGYCYTGETEEGEKCLPNVGDLEWVIAGLLIEDFEQDVASGEASEESVDLQATEAELNEKYRSREFADLRKRLEPTWPKLTESDSEPQPDMFYSQIPGLPAIPELKTLKDYLAKVASLSDEHDLNYEVNIDPVHLFNLKKSFFTRSVREHGKPRLYCRATKIGDEVKILTGMGLCFTKNFEPKNCPSSFLRSEDALVHQASSRWLKVRRAWLPSASTG